MNVIGRCVVAGGLRRSSELALGVWGDEPFAALKDPTELNALYARQAAVAERVESAQAIRAAINCKRAEQAGLSTFDPRRTEALRVLSGLETEYQSQLRLDTVWSTLDAEIARHPLRAWLWASNNSVLVPEDTADYSDVAARIARNGEPGLMWLHNVQRYGRMRDGDLTRGQPPIHGLRPDTAIGVNPCTTPDTLIHTRTGEYTIESLVGQSVEVWNGEGWATVVPRITGYDQPILKVTLSDGAFLKCTPSHNWYIRGSIVPVMARDLCVGDVIQGYPMPDDPVAAERLRSVVAIVDMGFAPVVYCFTESNTHRGTFNGIVTGQCGEQPLEHAESCLLVETFPGMHETPEDWHTTLKYAYLLGKAVSDIPIHDQQTQAVVSRNRRMGIGVAGIAEWYTKMGPAKMEAALDKGYREVRRIDALYAGWLGLPQSVRLTTVKPGGCRPWHSLTSTDRGLLTLEEMFEAHPKGVEWAPVAQEMQAYQGGTTSRVTQTYANGVAPVYRVRMSYNLTVESTAEHKWFVRTHYDRSKGGRYTTVDRWVRTDELRPDDILDVSPGAYTKAANAPLAACNALSIHMRGDAVEIKQPEAMTPDLGWLFGYLWGDGSQSPDCFRIRFCDDRRQNLEKAQRILLDYFGLLSTILPKKSNKALTLDVGSKHLWHWLIRNGVWKYWAGGIDCIPRVVRESSREVVCAFFAGLLDSDGCVFNTTTGTSMVWTTADPRFAQHMQDVAWAVGLGVGRSHQQRGASFQKTRSMFHLTLCAAVDPAAFGMLVRESTKAAEWAVSPEFKGWLWQRPSNRNGPRGLTVGKVLAVEPIGEMPTFDFEVENTHWYYAGAVRSHNSVPLVCGLEGGMRFPESPHYVRTIRVHDTSPLIAKIEAAGHRVEQDAYAPNTVCCYFPIRETRVGRYAPDVSLWEQAAIQALLQRSWSDNMVSATWMFQPHEAKDIGRVLAHYAGQLKGMSALPYSGHGYVQAPYIPCTEAEYVEMSAGIQPIDFNSAVVDHDTDEQFCSGGVCELAAK